MPADQLKIGSVVIVKPGDGVPADGIIVSGASRIDESMLTGEPAPVRKGIDHQVILFAQLFRSQVQLVLRRKKSCRWNAHVFCHLSGPGWHSEHWQWCVDHQMFCGSS